MKKPLLHIKKVNWFTIFFFILLILILIYWTVNIDKTKIENQKHVNSLFIIGLAIFIGATIQLMKKPLKFKFSVKKDNYHPENYSDHQEGKYRKNTK